MVGVGVEGLWLWLCLCLFVEEDGVYVVWCVLFLVGCEGVEFVCVEVLCE